MDMDVFIALHFFDQAGQFFLNILTGHCLIKIEGLAAELGAALDNMGFIALVRQVFGRCHAGDAAADNQGRLIDLKLGFFEGLHQGNL